MKIAMLGHKRIPSREGGVEIVVEKLSTLMAEKGHDVTAYNRGGKTIDGEKAYSTARRYDYHNVYVITVPTFQKKSLNAIVYSFLATLRAGLGTYDVIHFHAEGPCAMIPIARLMGKRCIATIHGLDWQRAKWGGFATRFLLFGEKMAVKYADEIIVLSQNVQKYFKDTYGRDTNFIPNGVDLPTLKEADIIAEKYSLQRNGYILFLARIVPEKGLHYLIEAYKQLDTDKKLVIAGGSSHTDEYVRQVREMIKGDNRIIMTGFVKGQELEELFSNCFLYVLPSDIEGMPISLLEALSYGKRCLVSDIPENLEVGGGYVECFQKGNSVDLKKQLESMLLTVDDVTEEDRIAYVSERFDWNKVVEQTLVLYEKRERRINI